MGLVYARDQHLFIWRYDSEDLVRSSSMHYLSTYLRFCPRSIARTAKSNKAQNSSPYPYGVVLEAIAESALVTWVGLVLYGIASLAPHGHITVSGSRY